MNKKLLVILGTAGALGYLFRNQLKSGTQAAEARFLGFIENRAQDFEQLKNDVAARVEVIRAEKEKES